MDNTAKTNSGGISFAGALTLIFIVLKLTGTISWSWVWVLSPLWIGVVACLGISLIVLLIWFIWAMVKR